MSADDLYILSRKHDYESIKSTKEEIIKQTFNGLIKLSPTTTNAVVYILAQMEDGVDDTVQTRVAL